MSQNPPSYQSHHFHNTDVEMHESNDTLQNAQESSSSAFHRATYLDSVVRHSSQRRTSYLHKPVVIPRVDTHGLLGSPLPFIRAYSPDLRAVDVHENEFVAFVDNLSIAQAPPAPLQALNTAGSIVGTVPHHWMALAGAGMNVTAGVGTAVVTKTRTRQFLEKVNREYFAPRGLKVSIYKDEHLMEKLRCDPNTPPLAQVSDPRLPDTAGYRRLQVLEPYIAPLLFNVPPPTPQRNVLDNIAAKQIQSKLKKKEKDGYSLDSSSSSDSSIPIEDHRSKPSEGLTRKDKRKAEKAERKRAEKEEKRDKKAAQKSSKTEDKKHKSNQTRLSKRVAKERKKIAKMEYIVVETLEPII